MSNKIYMLRINAMTQDRYKALFFFDNAILFFVTAIVKLYHQV
jgi:hypothetical protein